MRTMITFEADFPDDSKWDSHDNLVLPGGCAIANSLRDTLAVNEYECSKVAQHSHYGWEFSVSNNTFSAWCLLQVGESWLLRFDVPQKIDLQTVSQFQDVLHLILSPDQRYTNILWHEVSDFESNKLDRGTLTPRG